MKKNEEKKLELKLDNIKNDIFKNVKNSKITPKTPKTEKVKNKKSHRRRPHRKSSQN